MNRADELETLVKRAGSFTGLCKSITAGRNSDVTERELALLAKGYAMNRFPDLTPEQAFNKRFGDERMSDEARHFWDACGVAKGLRPARTEPETMTGESVDDPAETLRQLRELLAEQRRRTRMTGGDEDEDNDESDDESDEDDALDEITEKAQALRRRDPSLTEAQAFTKAYTDPANVELRKRERRQNGF
jgi:hypothetical protein